MPRSVKQKLKIDKTKCFFCVNVFVRKNLK